ncbi:CHASE domain-containing protein [Paucibacter sp. XJ19-41]|uniref:CHASE domain-containing protein n=1 Tax=Paucibacter sp. XJ19-41 TaxID=2927824 RepID=UPI00234AE76A|nr:CHASE domain-containing protein [Paucibacter sp. XJ19-41]MDC6167164.1 CHASE domain-containing protein [Paucibacter sp. XJ19-41]
MPRPHRLLTSWPVQALALALAYALLGLLTVKLAIPPNYASPLYPGAGLALAAVLCLGRKVAPGIWLGSFGVNLWLGQDIGLNSLLVPAVAGAGATLQALAGAWLVGRWVSQPLTLSEPRDLARFYLLGAGLACVVSASCGTAALLLVGAIAPADLGANWASWWLGDTVGVLIGAPVALTLLAQPRSAWAPRRLSVGLPLLIATLLMALATLKVSEWDAHRERSNFEREAAAAASALETALREPLGALEAMHGLLLVAPQISRADFERGSAAYLLPGGNLLALGWAAELARADVAAFDLQARADGLPDYHAKDRQRPGDFRPAADEPMLAIRLIEPLARNAPALGVNIRSIPASRLALQRAQRTALPSATAGFQLSQDSGVSIGVVVYQSLYWGQPSTEALRRLTHRGVVFATIRPDLLVQTVSTTMPAHLRICLVDTDPAAPHRRLAGPAGCETLPGAALHTLRPVSFAGRNWDIVIYAPQGGPRESGRSSWAFAMVGLLCTALLGALLLTVTGRARRIADLVQERTAELQHEVGERERASRALIESERRFRNIFDNVPIGIIFADLDGMPQEANPHICRMLGYTAEELLSRRSLAITHPDDRSEDVRLARLLLAGKIGMYRREKRYLAKDGRIVHGRALVSLLRDAKGEPYRLVGVVEDITDQLKMRELEHARALAEAANRAKNEFLSRMSHELRTPLNAMLGFTQLLEMDRTQPLSERQRGWAAQVQQAGWHLLEMINDTLDLSRIESGSMKLDLQRQNLAELLDDALALIEKPAGQRGIAIHKALDPQALHALGDATRIRQVLTNLLSNAVKYNIEGGSITIGTQRVDALSVELSVSDTGLGLSPAQLAALFQPFNRLGREHSGTEGTGIGLVICKRLAELMGGALTVSSVEGRGSRFALRLPAATEAGPEIGASAAPVAEPAYAAPRRVVYIEDNATNVEVMRGILAQRRQIRLEVHADGRSGLAAVLADPPDLLLLDMQLPDTTGLALLQALRAAPQCAALPVVAVSANALPDHIERTRAAGAQHYLTKPVEVRELLDLLDELLGGIGPQAK